MRQREPLRGDATRWSEENALVSLESKKEELLLADKLLRFWPFQMSFAIRKKLQQTLE